MMRLLINKSVDDVVCPERSVSLEYQTNGTVGVVSGLRYKCSGSISFPFLSESASICNNNAERNRKQQLTQHRTVQVNLGLSIDSVHTAEEEGIQASAAHPSLCLCS